MKKYPHSRFSSLQEGELKQVWQWRNLEDIRVNMHNKELIKWEDHLNWYNNFLQDDTRLFFVFYQNDRPIGVLNFQKLQDTRIEWGCYLGEKDAWPGSGLLLEIAALDFAASLSEKSLGLGKWSSTDTLYAEVLSFNTPVLKLHKLFGYDALPDKLSSLDGHTIKAFEYSLIKWRANRTTVLSRLPKQITAAAQNITFNL